MLNGDKYREEANTQKREFQISSELTNFVSNLWVLASPLHLWLHYLAKTEFFQAEITGDTVIKTKPPFNPPTSPLRIIHNNETGLVGNSLQRIESPVSQEDEEVVSIVRQGESARQVLRQCDSVLKDVERGEKRSTQGILKLF